jgi:Tfp pilus assembly protein PilO
MTHRRAKLIRILEGVTVGLVLLDLVAYFALIRPLRTLRAGEEARYTAARARVRDLKARVARLQTFQGTLPEAETQLGEFLKNYIPPRRQGFSRASRLVRKLTEESGVHLSGISYKLERSEKIPFNRLGFEVEVEGPFANVLKFSHALETAETFVVVRNFTLEPTGDRALALRLAADLYLTP